MWSFLFRAWFGNDVPANPRRDRQPSIRGGILEDLEEHSSRYRFACAQEVSFEREQAA